MRVIITGGTGIIGSALAESLVASGDEAIVLSRNADQARRPRAGIRVEPWDGRSADGWGHLADGADAIVNLAGENLSSGPWTEERKRRILRSRIDAGTAVLEAVKRASLKPRVVVQSSAVGYYGPRGDEIITERESPGNDFLARVCLDWEDSTRPLDDMGVRRAIVRTGVVLTMKGGALPRLGLPTRLFVGGPLGSGRQWLPWIHIADEIEAIRFLLANDNASGAFNLASPNPVINSKFSLALGRVLGRPSLFRTPAFPLRLLLGEMATVVLDGQRAVPARLQQLGFEFRFPELRAALHDLLRIGHPQHRTA